jgi:putative FmdB family regulatory protein
MPTYEYRCPKGHYFELFQKMSEEPRAECPECGAESERLLSGGAGFLFKGDGFYITDYRSESYRKDASKEESTVPSDRTEGSGKGKKADGSSRSAGGEGAPSSSPGKGGGQSDGRSSGSGGSSSAGGSS